MSGRGARLVHGRVEFGRFCLAHEGEGAEGAGGRAVEKQADGGEEVFRDDERL